MVDLTAFLKARLDEDGAAARAALEQSAEEGTRWWFDDAVPETPREFHVARHSPSRVLREVEAKRAILELHDGPHECSSYNEAIGEFDNCTWIDEFSTCSTLRHLAAIYSGHPDYRDEWKP